MSWYRRRVGQIRTVASEAEGVLPRGYIDGFTTGLGDGAEPPGGDDEHDITIATGICIDSTNAQNLQLTSTLRKRLDAAWMEGGGFGGNGVDTFPAPGVQASTWYHLFIIGSGGMSDAGFDTSLTATNLLSASGYGTYRRIGSYLTDGSSNLIGFKQFEDMFWWRTPRNVAVSNHDTTKRTITIDTPDGFSVMAQVAVQDNAAEGDSSYFFHPDLDDPTVGVTNVFNAGGRDDDLTPTVLWIQTDDSSQISHKRDTSSITGQLVTLGWIDPRGRNGSA